MKDKQLIIIPFMLPWDWSADYQRQTCLKMAKKHTVIAYMEKDAVFFLKALLKKRIQYPKHRNIVFYQPLYIFPFRRIRAVERLNQIVSFLLFRLFVVRFQKSILWIFDPYFYYVILMARCTTLYDCVDYAWSKNQTEFEDIQRIEKTMIRKVGYFFVNSYILYAIHKSTRKPDRIVPQGFRLQDFKTYSGKSCKQFIHKSVIGYVGAINHRIDFRLLLALSRRNPGYQFVLWGCIQDLDNSDLQTTKAWVDILRKETNISIGHSIYRTDIPGIIRQFDIAIIPYVIGYKSVKYSYPMKLFEYFYVGKPVISTPIEELKRFPKYVKIGSTVESWEKNITSLLSRPWPKLYQKGQRKLAIENSWERKIGMIMNYVSELDQSKNT
jgi:glycosyltransferase involved in cell wall biosynthesis